MTHVQKCVILIAALEMRKNCSSLRGKRKEKHMISKYIYSRKLNLRNYTTGKDYETLDIGAEGDDFKELKAEVDSIINAEIDKLRGTKQIPTRD